ncbi:hypothetical protein EJ03DRAFT_36269 [Teratosphaeria nubilosa]|uniref:Cytochrome b561 domain-containing protein n=1 Tax=Teratosphaeria nubilosa TaxID=161662 RepID=A0A6G1LG84_9PEZI|nr:hypothetical protein EJ03DRAFT_36269 [Teratosphaeria nubilosa]
MSPFRSSISTLVTLWLSSAVQTYAVDGATPNANRNPQLCIKDTSTFPLDLCLAIPDGSASEGDVQLAFSGLFEQQRGWAAVGPGTSMNDGLMFVFYPSGSSQNLTIGVRSTTGHYPPELDERLTSRLEVSYNSFDASNGLYEAGLICRGCAQHLRSRHAQAISEAWIWSFNYLQETQTDDADIGLGLHSHYDTFSFDVLSSDKQHNGPVDDQLRQLRISSDRSSRLVVSSHDRSHSRFGVPSLGLIHGALMALAFLVAFPSGAIVMRYRAAMSFPLHIALQLGGVLLCLGGLLAIVLHIGLSQWTWHTHTVLGLLLVISVVAQVITGYLHHVRFAQTHARSNFTHVHMFAGRTSIILGFANTAT